ncbi:hypothetical protein DF947_21005 [Pedobacter paludis]|uniref:histidine kinase n=2 Tax=Pedobacter paludis TaxID=2203212 RepID=A0A317EVP5_9SPHI|nr:hypothetical protein DF947_21005 [Pedobacter paludis]
MSHQEIFSSYNFLYLILNKLQVQLNFINMIKKTTSTFIVYLKLLIAFSCVFTTKVIAQNKQTLLFKHLTQEDGLSDPTIKALHTDKDNFLWIGTENGLNRFDGTSCITYKESAKNRSSFPGNYITKIIEDKGGNLIIGSQSNLVKYNKAKDSFEAYSFSNPNLKSNYYSFPFYIDAEENLWVYLAGNVYKYAEKQKKLSYVTTYSNGYAFTPIPCYKKLNWFVSRGVKGIYLNEANDVKEKHVKEFFMGSQTLVSHIEDVYFASDTLFWMAGDKGLIKLNPASKKYQTFNSYLKEKNIACTAIAKYPGKPWLFVGTRNNGLLIFDLTTEKFIDQYVHQSSNLFSLSANYIRRIYIDKKQNLFISVDGYGLDYTNLNKVIFPRYLDKKESNNANFDNDISYILKDKYGKIWCGTKNSGLLIYNQGLDKSARHEFLKMGISKLVELDNGNLLIELSTGSFYIYVRTLDKFLPLKTSFSKTYNGKVQINQIMKFGDDLYTATEYGVAKANIRNNESLFLNMVDDINRSLNWPNIQRLIPISKNKLLVQTFYTSTYLYSFNNGQFKYEKEIGRSPYAINGNVTIGDKIFLATTSGLIKYNTTTSILDNLSIFDANCTSILADKNQNLWIGSNNGLYFYDNQKQSKTRYTISDGLQSMVFNSNSISLIDENQIAIGGINGINLFNPNKTNIYKSVSQPKITEILINDQPYTESGNPITTNNLNLKHNQNTLTFAFSSMDYINPKQRKIVYRMVGYDNKEVTVLGSNRIRFPNMPSGSFKLELLDAQSNLKTTLSITIGAPFWQKWWFISSMSISLILLSALVLYLYLRWIKHQQLLQLRQMINFQKADRKRIADDLHDDLGLKLSSLKHYLLAGDINKMIDSGELRTLSSEYIDEAVNVLRTTLINLSPKTLDESGLIIALQDLTESIGKLGIVKIHFDYSGFTTVLKSAQQYALYRICQELINNTIKHAQAKNIYISIINRDEKLILLYEDDGKGFDYESVKRGYGLSNIEAHVKAIKADIELDTEIGKGVAVTIIINLRQNIKFKIDD